MPNKDDAPPPPADAFTTAAVGWEPEQASALGFQLGSQRAQQGGPWPGEATRLRELLTDRLSSSPSLLQPLEALLDDPDLERLLIDQDPRRHILYRAQLQERLSGTFSLRMVGTQLAFLDGLRAGFARDQRAVTRSERRQSHHPLQTGVLAALTLAGLFAAGWLLASRWLHPEPKLVNLNEALIYDPSQSKVRQKPLPPQPVPGAPILPQRSATPLTCSASSGTPLPSEIEVLADNTNYGRREPRNWRGEPLLHKPSIIVLHETVLGRDETIRLFQTSHPDDGAQASYHVLIDHDGQRFRTVPDEMRAFGAGDSSFKGFSIQVKEEIPASINNVALHVSLVTPPDGRIDDDRRTHSGYSEAQYQGLAAQVALWQQAYGIPKENITTHQEVDRSGSRHDPRSFDWLRFRRSLDQIALRC